MAASSGNPNPAAVLGRLLPHGEVCAWPPARPAQLSPAEIVEFQGSVAASGGPCSPCLRCCWLLLYVPLVMGLSASCLLVRPSPSLRVVCGREWEGEQEPVHPLGSGSASSLASGLLRAPTLQGSSPSNNKSELSVFLCRQDHVPTAAFLAQAGTDSASS